MTTRTISTRLAIEGENEYRRAIQACNAEMATMKSQLALVESEFRGNANSLAALTAKGETLIDMYGKQTEKLEILESALENARKAQERHRENGEKYARQLAEASERMEQLKSSSGDTAEAQEELQKEIDALKSSLENCRTAEDAAGRAIEDYTKKANYTRRDINDLSAEISDCNKYMEEARGSADGCATSINEYGKAAKDAGDKSKDFGGKSSQAVSELAAALAAAGVVAGLKEIAQALEECSKAAIKFEQGMSEVYTLLPSMSQEAREAMNRDMLDFSTQMNVVTEQAIPALYQAISASVPQENVFSFLEVAQKAAVGGVSELETAVDGLTSVINAYGEDALSAGQASDIMFTAVKLGKTNFDELSKSLYNVIPTASSTGVAFEDIAAALAVMTARGTPTNVATTQLRQALVELNKDGSNTSDLFKEIAGKSFKEFIASGGNLQGALQLLENRARTSNKSISDLFGSVEAGNAALSLTGGASESFTAALQQMEEAAGATDAAYQTMTETAAYSSQRVETAFSNLKIAIGDQLQPALNGLRDAGAGAMEWAAQFVQDNPWIVGAITAVTTALGALTVAITGLMVVKKIQPLIESFTLTLRANPIVAVASAITGVVAALGMYIASTKDAKESTTECLKSFRESREAYEETKKGIQENQSSTESLIAALETLSGKEQKTAVDKAALLDIVGQLNEAVPELALAYDAETDSLNLTAEAVKELAQAEFERINQQADIERITTLYQEQETAGKSLAAAKEDLVAAEEAYAEVAEMTISAAQDGAGAKRFYENQVQSTRRAVEELTGELEENAQEIEELAGKYNESTEAAETYTEDTESIIASTDKLKAKLKETETAYEEAYQAAKESIENQIGLFETLDGAADRSIEDLIGSLQSQVDFMYAYADNLQKAMELGVDQGIIDKLSDGSVESARILDAIVKDGGKNVDLLNEKFAEVEKGKEAMAKEMAEAKTLLDEIMEQTIREMGVNAARMNRAETAAESGRNTMQGFIDGIGAKEKPMIERMAQMARKAMKAFNDEMEIRSPSRKLMESGKYAIDGYIQGVEEKAADLKEVMQAAADIAIESFQGNDQAKGLAKDFVDAYSAALSDAAEQAKASADEIKDSLDGIADAWEETVKEQEAMTHKLADYGELLKETKNSYGERVAGLTDLQEQIDTLDRYGQALQALKDRGISNGLMDEVTSMSVDEAITYADELLKLTDDKWQEYNDLWDEKQQLAIEIAEQYYQEQLSALETEYSDQLAQALDKLESTSFDSGVDTVKGLIEGLKAKEDALYAKARQIADNIASTIRGALDIQSPSKVMMELGKYTAQGLEVGFEDEIENLKTTIAAALPSAYDFTRQDTGREQTAALVNAIGTLTTGLQGSAPTGDLSVTLVAGGVDIARAIIEDFRNVDAQSPQLEGDLF